MKREVLDHPFIPPETVDKENCAKCGGLRGVHKECAEQSFRDLDIEQNKRAKGAENKS